MMETTNKIPFTIRQHEKVTCDCGGCYELRGKSNHIKTQRHKQFELTGQVYVKNRSPPRKIAELTEEEKVVKRAVCKGYNAKYYATHKDRWLVYNSRGTDAAIEV